MRGAKRDMGVNIAVLSVFVTAPSAVCQPGQLPGTEGKGRYDHPGLDQRKGVNAFSTVIKAGCKSEYSGTEYGAYLYGVFRQPGSLYRTGVGVNHYDVN